MINQPFKFNRDSESLLSSITGAFIKSEFNFYETGSRFFKTEKSDSDYDYFVKDSEGVHHFLKKKGFKGMWNPTYILGTNASGHYGDSSLKSLYLFCGKGIQVHIQIIKPEWMNCKIKAHEVIYNNGWHYYFRNSKDNAKMTWDLVLKTLMVTFPI